MHFAKPHMPRILVLISVPMLCVSLFCAAPIHADLIGYWTFDDQTAEDASGFGHDGILAGSVLPSYSGDVPPSVGAGFSLFVPGGDSHVLVPHAETLNITDEITIMAWVKTSGPDNGWDGILAKNPSDGSSANHAGNYELRVEQGSRNVHFLHQRGGMDDTAFYLSPETTVTDGKWEHVAVTAATGGTVDFYLNGVLTDSLGIQDPFGATNTNPLYIGSRADLFTPMDGLLDEVQLWDSVLSAGEIEAFCNCPDVPPPTEYNKLPISRPP